MIDYSKTEIGDILRITGDGAPGYAEDGDLVKVDSIHKDAVRVVDRYGKYASFTDKCGSARLNPTEWKDEFPETDD